MEELMSRTLMRRWNRKGTVEGYDGNDSEVCVYVSIVILDEFCKTKVLFNTLLSRT
jgi:hypothetical protein